MPNTPEHNPLPTSTAEMAYKRLGQNANHRNPVVSGGVEASSATQAGMVKEPLELNSEASQIRARKLASVLAEMGTLPLWVQQVIYTDLKQHLEKNVTLRTLSSFSRENFLQLWTPNLTQRGVHLLHQQGSRTPSDTIKLLYAIRKCDNVAMMCARYEWSLQTACHALIECLRDELIDPPESRVLEASLRFLGDEIRIGEYLVLIGRVDAKQLEQALKTQEYIETAMGERTRIADIMVRLELVTHEDVESILFLKDESTKAFKLFGSIT
jgi:hypothetical protein